MKQTLSVVIAAKNCEDRIQGTISPWIGLASEVIVVDQNSSDKTAAIAKETGASVFLNEPPQGNFDMNRKFGLQKANSEWILYIDTDERPTNDLLFEIKNFLESDESKNYDGVKIPNYFYFLGKQLKYGLYNPKSAEVRMFRNGKWDYPCEKGYHHSVSVKGKVHTLQNGYKHFNVNALSEWFVKTNQYTEHDAEQKLKNGANPSAIRAIFKAKKFFVKYYFFKLGFLDGMQGFLSVFYFMLYHFTLDMKILEKKFLNTKTEGQDYLKSFATRNQSR